MGWLAVKGDEHLRALRGKSPGNRRANAVICARDQDDLVFKRWPDEFLIVQAVLAQQKLKSGFSYSASSSALMLLVKNTP